MVHDVLKCPALGKAYTILQGSPLKLQVYSMLGCEVRRKATITPFCESSYK